MDEGIAVGHAPREPLSNQLDNYVRVNFENIDWDNWYYVTDEDDYDYIVYVTRHGEDPEPPEFVRVVRKYRRKRDDAENEWDVTDEVEPNVLTEDDIHQGKYKFYVYNNSENIQEGGGLAEDVRSALSKPVYTLPAGTDFSKAVLPAKDRFQEQNVLVQEQAGIPALPLVVRHKSRKSRSRRRSRKVQKSRKRKTRRKH